MINVLSCVTDKDSRVFVAIEELREDVKTVKILLGSLINASAPLLTENVSALPEHTFPLTSIDALKQLDSQVAASNVTSKAVVSWSLSSTKVWISKLS